MRPISFRLGMNSYDALVSGLFRSGQAFSTSQPQPKHCKHVRKTDKIGHIAHMDIMKILCVMQMQQNSH